MAHEIEIPAFAAAHRDGALVVDVREPQEYVTGHVPGARLLPMREVPARLAELAGLAGDGRVYVICATGNRSLTAVRWMAGAGIDAVSVAGGTAAWVRSGGPVARGPHENAA